MARPGRKRRDRMTPRDIAPTVTAERQAQRIAIVGNATVDDRERGRRAAWEVWDGTLLGVLLYRHWITEAGHTAGQRFDSLSKRYGDLLRGSKLHHEPPPEEAVNVPTPEQEAAIFRDVKARYDAATHAIGSMDNRRAVADVLRGHVCDHEVWDGFLIRYSGRMSTIRDAFDNLARFYRDA